ncbi:MAG: hypothetical protein WKF76_12555 [Nocardioidaceae bacterium]
MDSAISCSAQSAKPEMPEPRSTMATLSWPFVAAQRRGEHESGIVGPVHLEKLHDGLGLVEKLGHIDPGETGRDEAERRQGAVATADVRVGQENAAVALVTSELLQVGAGVGHHDKP